LGGFNNAGRLGGVGARNAIGNRGIVGRGFAGRGYGRGYGRGLGYGLAGVGLGLGVGYGLGGFGYDRCNDEYGYGAYDPAYCGAYGYGY